MAHRLRGFTLVEVLVALSIMAVMALIGWRGIDSMLRAREISQASLARSERLQTVLAQWEQDLRALQDSSDLEPIRFDGASLLLTRQREDGMLVVRWSVRNQRLYRWESAVQTSRVGLAEAYQRSQQALAQEQDQLVALEGVSAWQMFFYRGNAWSNAQSSGDVQDGAKQPPAAGGDPPKPNPRAPLPSGVRMVLEFREDSGFGGPLTRQLELGLQS